LTAPAQGGERHGWPAVEPEMFMRRPRPVEFPLRARAPLWSAIFALALAGAAVSSCSATSGGTPGLGGTGGTGSGEPDASATGGSGSERDGQAPTADTAAAAVDAKPEMTTASDAAAGPDAAAGGPLTGVVPIMVLGSSNETGTCWRAFLWQKLRAAGVTSFDFVGRTSVGPDCGVPGYDKDVEAAPGTIITGFSANDFAVRFKAHPPRIVLVHVGGADARDGVPIPKILAAYTLAVEQARAVEPHVMFFVAQHTPQQPPTGIQELNAAIPGWARQISTPDAPVAAVDLYTGIVPATDQSDGTHLNVAGSQKVAQWWLDVLLPLFKP
jgi:acyl-CoA thioesterase-1